MPNPKNIKYFKTPDDLRRWFKKNHRTAKEQWVGYHKKDSGKQSITWPESVDQALCFGWIDGIRKSVDATRYTIRFTPRKLTSNWSDVNIRRVRALKKLGLLKRSGRDVFEKRNTKKLNQYSFEQKKDPTLPVSFLKRFKSNKKGWKYFSLQSPWYKRTSTWWVISAKQETTRAKRLVQLIHDSEYERSSSLLTRKK